MNSVPRWQGWRDVTIAKLSGLYLAFTCTFFACSVPLWAQSALNQTTSSSGSEGLRELTAGPTSNGRPGNGQPGGGGMADFGQLINLIQSVVDSDWDADGGTDTIQTSVNGVWIHVDGKLLRKKAVDPKLAMPQPKSDTSLISLDLPLINAIQPRESLRWISLKDVENKVDQALAHGGSISAEARLLGGLTRIDYLAWDDAANTWLLGGPAGELVVNPQGDIVGRGTGLPPIALEDLLALAPLVLNGRGPMGCSIDPVPERLKAVSQLVASPISQSNLVQQANRWCDKLTATLGDQRATVFGLPEDSPTAIALLIADEHMKRVGLGLEDKPTKLLTYWDEAEKRGTMPTSAMIRWWFALRDNIEVGESLDRKVFSLASPTVQVLSQDQWMDQMGQRFDAQQSDPSAEAFAQAFTQHFDDLQQMYPAIYGRLRHIFDLSVVLKMIRDESNSKHLALPKQLTDKAIQPHSAVAIQWIPSIAAWRKTSGGRVAAIVSGGVAIEIQKAKFDRSQNTESPSLTEAFPLK